MGKRHKKNNLGRFLAVAGLVLVVLVGIFIPTTQVKADYCWDTVLNSVVPVGAGPSVANCQGLSNSTGNPNRIVFKTGNPPVSGTITDPCGNPTDPGYSACQQKAVDAAKTAADAQAASANANGCGLFGWSIKGCFWTLIELIASFIMRICSLLLMLAGTILDYVLQYTIVNMAAHVNGGTLADGTNSTGLTGINIAWKVIRDLMNIGFIFLLVYEGIKMIIGYSDTTKIKKFITGVVLASLLINFSLFFTKVIIDASNIVTIGIYNSIVDNSASASNTAPVPGQSIGVKGLSAPFMRALGLQSFFGVDVPLGNDSGATALTLGLGSILFLVVAFVFFAVTCLFVVRYLVLILLLMLSPIAYMGMALPFMKTYADQWWTAFKSQLLFAPIYMIITWVVLTLMTSPGFITNGDFSTLATANNTSALSVLLNFAVIIGLAIASLVIAKNTSTKGSQYISKMTGTVTAFAGGAVMGGAARFGRSTVGKWGNSAADDEDLKRRAAEGERYARMKLATANRMAKSSFDVRSTGKFQSLAKTSDVNFGKDSGKENYRTIREEQEKKAAEKAKQYKPSEDKYEKARNDDRVAKAAADERIKNAEREIENTGNTKEEAENRLESVKGKMAKLQKEQDENLLLSPERKAEIEKETEDLKHQAQEAERGIADMDKMLKDKRKVLESARKAKKDYKTEESKLNELYESRVGKVAAGVGHEDDTDAQWGWRAVANTVGTAMYTAGIGPMPKTKTDREVVARKMRAEARGKSKAEKLAEAAQKYQKEIEEKEGGGESSTKPATTATSTTPTSTPPSTPPTPETNPPTT